jgi:hypothetical protein
MVNNTSPTIDKLTGKSYDRVHRNDYKNCCSGGKWPYPLEVFQTVKMVLYGSKRGHNNHLFDIFSPQRRPHTMVPIEQIVLNMYI